MRLGFQNAPFYTRRLAEVRAAEWFTGLFKQFQYGNGVRLRRIHYRIVSQKTPVLKPDRNPYLNTSKGLGYEQFNYQLVSVSI